METNDLTYTHYHDLVMILLVILYQYLMSQLSNFSVLHTVHSYMFIIELHFCLNFKVLS